LQQIKNVVRLGRVNGLETERIVFEKGSIETSTGHLHVDCSARAISNLVMKPVFDGKTITPQTVRPFQPVFSAAFIAHVEANYPDEQTKNKICRVVPLPDRATDWIPMTLAMMVNQQCWSQDEGLRDWLLRNRLDGFSKLVRSAAPDNAEHQAILQRLRRYATPAAAKLQKFAAQLAQQSPQAERSA